MDLSSRPPGGFCSILFDFDGVILDSARLKTEAFVHCYAGAPEDRLREIVAYQERHGGIGRREKFAHFERTLFGRSGDAATVDELCARFARHVDTAMLEAPFIPGALEALRALSDRMPLHLVSGMPEIELRQVVEKRGLAPFFASIDGSPTTKLTAFRRILDERRTAPTHALAIGDSLTEYDAACALGIPFLAVRADGAPDFFPPHVPRRRDLLGLAELVLTSA